jgi:hypothetical protein
MFTVYFENQHYSEQVAIFSDEETYINCLPALELLAKESDMNVLVSKN